METRGRLISVTLHTRSAKTKALVAEVSIEALYQTRDCGKGWAYPITPDYHAPYLTLVFAYTKAETLAILQQRILPSDPRPLAGISYLRN